MLLMMTLQYQQYWYGKQKYQSLNSRIVLIDWTIINIIFYWLFFKATIYVNYSVDYKKVGSIWL